MSANRYGTTVMGVIDPLDSGDRAPPQIGEQLRPSERRPEFKLAMQAFDSLAAVPERTGAQ